MGVPIFRSPSPENTRTNQKDEPRDTRQYAGVRRRTAESRQFTTAQHTAARVDAQSSPSRNGLRNHRRRPDTRAGSWERYAARHGLPPPPVRVGGAILVDSTQDVGGNSHTSTGDQPVTLVLPSLDTLSRSPLPMTREGSADGANLPSATMHLTPVQDRSGRLRRLEVDSLQQMGEQMLAEVQRGAPSVQHSDWANIRSNDADSPRTLRMVPRDLVARTAFARNPSRRLTRSRTIRDHRPANDIHRAEDMEYYGRRDERYDARAGISTVVDGPLIDGPLLDAPVSTSHVHGTSSRHLSIPADSLGDQNRSPSSPDFMHWDRMLSTIAPDRTLPSADSSFTSAAASASFTNSRTHSAGSSQAGDRARSVPTSESSVSIAGQNNRANDDDCETDESSAVERDGRRIVRLGYSSIHQLPRPSVNDRRDRYHSRENLNDLADDNYYGPLPFDNHYDTGRRAPDELFEMAVASRQAEIRADARRRERTLPPLGDEELETYRPWIERLASREDIPDEWWSSVGLTPSMRTGVANANARMARQNAAVESAGGAIDDGPDA